MTLGFADKCAAAAREWLGAFALRLEVAGSVRRRRPVCSDLDLVVIPTWREVKDLMGVVIKRENLLAAEVRRRAQAEGWTIRQDGEEILSFVAKSVQTDIFFTTAEAWGSVLLCRTGSAAHNIRLIERAKALGGKWHPTRGVYIHGKVIGSVGETEEAIFDALEMEFVRPEDREVGGGR